MAKPWLSQTADGRFRAPAFVDRHCHPLFAAREASALDLSGCGSLDDIRELLCGHLARNPEAKWIDATPFDRNLACDDPAAFLDSVSAVIPITLHSNDHHALWVNSAALSVAGFDDEIPQLSDAEVVCGASGKPTGLLLEWGAMKLVLDKQPLPSLEEDLVNLSFAQKKLSQAGITAVSDAWIDPGMGEIYLEAARRHVLEIPVELWIRVSPDEIDAQLAYVSDLMNAVAAFASNKVMVAGVKVFLDGVISSKTAALLDDYHDHSSGKLIWSDESLDNLIRQVALIDPAMRPHFHAIGDAAVRQALDTIERANTAGVWLGARQPVIAHAELVSDADATRFSQLGIEAVISPQWLTEGFDEALIGLIGEQRTANVGDFTPLLGAGASLTYGSDWPVTEPNPMLAIARATSHLIDSGYATDKAVTAAWRIASGPNWQPENEDEQSFVFLNANPLEIARTDAASIAGITVSLD